LLRVSASEVLGRVHRRGGSAPARGAREACALRSSRSRLAVPRASRHPGSRAGRNRTASRARRVATCGHAGRGRRATQPPCAASVRSGRVQHPLAVFRWHGVAANRRAPCGLGRRVNTSTFRFVASAPRGLADLLAQELISFGAANLREQSTGVHFAGTLETAYRACLESRIANRILPVLAEKEVASADELYAFARETDWSAHIGEDVTLACGFSGKHSSITHTHFGALRLKDAIVDTLREQTGVRPDIDREYPGVRVHAHARGQTVTLALDLSGESLHRRGYRTEAGEAPLKENVAAGMLIRAGWPQLAAAGAEFLDPMCGSGTLVIE